MKLPLSLIKSFLEVDLPPVKIAEALTLLGIEVDRIENGTPPFGGVVVGEVLSVRKHPDAKNLQIAEVSDGAHVTTVVCGAPNCRAGIKTAFAKVGAVLTDADGMTRRIEATSIRGVPSAGMLCSPSELRLSGDHAGILELPQETKTGQDAAHLLWDPVFELSLTPNLGHCLSALGIARELSAGLRIPLTLNEEQAPSVNAGTGKKITIHPPKVCRRYLCCLIEGVEAGPSPFWLRRQLEACGQKSINRVVDAANYAMLKFGQPLHAFDYDLLEGDRIEAELSPSPFRFLGLDGVEREVPPGTLLISDGRKPVAIAGIMGGANTAVSEKTTRVLLEAAWFDSASIRTASRKIGLRSESSQRFEKGVDPEGVEPALFAAAALIGGRIKGYADTKGESFQPREIRYRSHRINQLLGTRLSESEIEEMLQRLGFEAKAGVARVPSYRFDVSEEIDLVEETARVYGYNNIDKSTPRCSTSLIPNDPDFVFEQQIRTRLCGLGLFEFLCGDLISPKLADAEHMITPQSMECLKASYSKSEEYSALRTSLLPGLLQAAKGNFAQKNKNIAGFEIGRIHFLQHRKPVEIPMAAILLCGKKELPHWSHKSSDFDYFDLKGMIENVVPDGVYASSTHLVFHPGRQADLRIEDLIVGSLGELHPSLLQKFDIEEKVFYAELNLLHLLKFQKTHFRMHPLPQFPSSERDWTVPLEPNTPIDRVFAAIHSQNSFLLEKAELIDLYNPEGGGQKNATFRLIYRDPMRTTSFEEVESEHSKIVDAVVKLLAK